MSAFLTRAVLHKPQDELAANVIQILEPITQKGPITVRLDIDVYQAKELPTDVTSLTPTFDRLHTYKNEIFFSYLTERAVRLFE